MAKTNNRLGKGLNALINSKRDTPQPPPSSDTHQPYAQPNAASTQDGRLQVHALPLSNVIPNPKQPRRHFDEARLRELADSIATHGVLQPIIVRKVAGQYEIIAGERRWRASQLAGLNEIPVLIRNVGDADSFEFALIENLQREDLDPLERAMGYQNYLDAFHVSIERLAKRLGESRANVSNYLRLLKLAPAIREMLTSGELGMGHARALTGVEDPARQLALAKLAVRRNLSVRQIEDLVRNETERGAAEAEFEDDEEVPRGDQQHLQEVARAFSKALGMSVKLMPGRRKNSGRIVIRYRDLDEFDQLAERLQVKDLLD